jgi:hypothetical protein
MKRALVGALALILIVGRLFVPASAATQYTYTRIASTGGSFYREIIHAIINNAGQVAFYTVFTDGAKGIMMGDEHGLVTVADTRSGVFEDFLQVPAINDRGVVAFTTGLSLMPSAGVWKWDSGRLRRIVDTSTGLRSFYVPSLNASGDIAFWSRLADNSEGIFISVNNNKTVKVATGFLDVLHLDTAPMLSNSGSVVFKRHNGLTGFDELLYADPKGRIRTIADSSGPYDHFDEAPTVNGSDVIVFGANRANFLGHALVQATPTGGLTELVGQGAVFGSVFWGAINAIGQIAFNGQSNTYVGTGNAIFTGPNPVADQAVNSGDILDGETVLNIEFFRGLNDHGQIAFVARFATHAAIYRADPVVP